MKPRKTRKESTGVVPGLSSRNGIDKNISVLLYREEFINRCLFLDSAMRGQRSSKDFTIETLTDSSYASAVRSGKNNSESEQDQNDPEVLPEFVPFMYGNAAVETVRGIIHLYRTDYGFDISEVCSKTFRI